MKYVSMLVGRWHALGRRDVLATLLMVAFVAAILAGLVWLSPASKVGNGGFGPDWDCTYPGKGDPVCVKKPLPAASGGKG